jgi:hypothetical protein
MKGGHGMKQFRITAWILAALVFLPAASVWEGAAAVAPGGELPESGYYAATNSFPRNTVVELTNLETGKTVQVIVALGLDSPGLLATVSRDAAAAIGLQSRSIGRIRMTQPRDPIAFSRFIDGLGSSGDPDFDPRARVELDLAAGGSPSAEGPAAVEADGAAETSPPAVETPLWAGEAAETGAVASAAASAAAAGETVTEAAGENTVVPETGTGTAAAAAAAPAGEDAGAVIAEVPAEIPAEELPAETPETGPVIAEVPAESPAEVPAGGPAEIPVEVPLEAPADPGWDLAGAEPVLVPAEERPPERMGPAEFHEPLLPEISFSELPHETYPEKTVDPRFMVDPVEPENLEPGAEIAVPSGGGAAVFSAPLIGRLEQGKYYVQLGAYSRAELVEAELRRIGRAYPVAIQNGGSSERPLYRILLGPVNLGESGAILQRFKGSGYSDAFVRQGS